MKNLPKPVPCDYAQVQLEITGKTLPISVSIEVPGGRTQRVLEAGIRLPHRHTELYSTADAHQMAAEFHIVMGERTLARDNLDVARLRVRNLKWSGAGVPKIEIAFDIDKAGLLAIEIVNKDRKSTELLAYVAMPAISAKAIGDAQADALAHREEDEEHERNIEMMLSGYLLLDQAYERYAIAKRRMGFSRKRAYKQTRRELEKSLNVMPPEATKATMAELEAALDAFRSTYADMEPDYRAVMSWWNKK